MPKANASPYKGMTMKKMVASHLAPVAPTYTRSAESEKESAHNEKLQAYWNARNFMGNVITRVILPNDGKSDDSVHKAQQARQAEWNRQSSMPWGNSFMHTPTDAQRLNNPAQYSAVRQRQLTAPNTYGQFYAFMHALSAAFGNLNAGG